MNEKQIGTFLYLAEVFKTHHFNLYLVGGSVRDYLLNIDIKDLDVVTDATPKEMKEFLKEANYTFEKFGSVSLVFEGLHFDVTTLRKEKGYVDFRHPDDIEFVKDLSIDVKRRDFTINALYLDSSLRVIDLVKGQKDLESHLIRMIGEPNQRLKEDPLRILRAIRFHFDYSFDIDKKLLKAIKNNISLVDKLNPQKVNQEVNKSNNKENIYDFLSQMKKK